MHVICAGSLLNHTHHILYLLTPMMQSLVPAHLMQNLLTGAGPLQDCAPQREHPHGHVVPRADVVHQLQHIVSFALGFGTPCSMDAMQLQAVPFLTKTTLGGPP